MIRRIELCDFDYIYDIMKSSFPIDEYATYEEHRNLLTNENYIVYGYEYNNTIVGFIALWKIENFIYIPHFAVDKRFRGNKIGDKLLNYAISISDGFICLEAEPPVDEISKRRIAFYERHNFYYNDYDYIQPPISLGRKPVSLKLMTYGSTVDQSDYKNIRDAIYEYAYDCISLEYINEKAFIFKKATVYDTNQILSLYKSLIGTQYCAWTEQYPDITNIENDLKRNCLFCLKDLSGKIAAVISIDDDPETDMLPNWDKSLQPSIELARVGVDIAFQNKKIAPRLIKNVMSYAKKKDIKSAHFLVSKSNIKALRSYSRLNFKLKGDCSLFQHEWWCYEQEL